MKGDDRTSSPLACYLLLACAAQIFRTGGWTHVPEPDSVKLGTTFSRVQNGQRRFDGQTDAKTS